MTLRYFLTDYTEESYPAAAPTLDAWAAWLADPTVDGEDWGREDPAQLGEEFEGYVTAEVDRMTFEFGADLPTERVKFDWCCIAGDWESSGATLAEATTECDAGDEVEIIFFKDTNRRYRFELAGGLPALVDTDPATAPVSAEAVREQIQPALL